MIGVFVQDGRLCFFLGWCELHVSGDIKQPTLRPTASTIRAHKAPPLVLLVELELGFCLG